jgi:hypothetical protein
MEGGAMRIKLRCPHCGDWFTLNLGIENGEAETRESEPQSEEADADDEPVAPPARPSRARLIGAACVVAAVVIIMWAAAALKPHEEGGAAQSDEVSLRPTTAVVQADLDRGELDESEAREEAPVEAGSALPRRAGGEVAAPGGADARGGDERAAGERDSPRDGEPTAARGEAVAPVVERQTPVAEARAERPRELPAAALDRDVLELGIEALDRCWIHVEADGVVVADATLDEGERRSWRADGFFEIDVGRGDAVRLSLNGRDLGRAGADARVVDGLRITRDGIRGR